MRSVVIHSAHDLRVEPLRPVPLVPGQVRVRFAAGGICGSDLHYFAHGGTGNIRVTAPLTLGHEVAGIVADDAGGDLAGQRVAVCPSVPCGVCRPCRDGRDNICEQPFFMGSASRVPHMQGGFRGWLDVWPGQCHVLPDSVSLEAGALVEPVAVSVHAVGLIRDLLGKRLAVIGAGPIGLLITAVARARGADHVTVRDLSATALERAYAVGADAVVPVTPGAPAEPGDFDAVVEASGSPHGLNDALTLVRRGGQVVQVGNLPGGVVPTAAVLIMNKELAVSGSFRFTVREYGAALDLIAAGTVDPLAVVTGRFVLADAVDAFAQALDRTRHAKVLLLPDGDDPAMRTN